MNKALILFEEMKSLGLSVTIDNLNDLFEKELKWAKIDALEMVKALLMSEIRDSKKLSQPERDGLGHAVLLINRSILDTNALL